MHGGAVEGPTPSCEWYMGDVGLSVWERVYWTSCGEGIISGSSASTGDVSSYAGSSGSPIWLGSE